MADNAKFRDAIVAIREAMAQDKGADVASAAQAKIVKELTNQFLEQPLRKLDNIQVILNVLMPFDIDIKALIEKHSHLEKSFSEQTKSFKQQLETPISDRIQQVDKLGETLKQIANTSYEIDDLQKQVFATANTFTSMASRLL